MGRLSDKVVLITGASGYIGRATALRFAEEGARVVVAYHRGRDRAEESVAHIKRLGTDAVAMAVDISRPAEIRQLVTRAIDHFGRIDVYVDCSGGLQPGAHTDSTPSAHGDLFDYVIEVNFKGQFRCADAVIPHMRSQGSGSIVFTSSAAKDGIQVATNYRDLGHRVAYAASKAAIVGMTRTMANYLAEMGIRVNCVVPGPTNDERQGQHNRLVPLGRWGTTTEVANAILFLASDEASFVTGEAFYVSGGFAGGGFSPSLVQG